MITLDDIFVEDAGMTGSEEVAVGGEAATSFENKLGAVGAVPVVRLEEDATDVP